MDPRIAHRRCDKLWVRAGLWAPPLHVGLWRCRLLRAHSTLGRYGEIWTSPEDGQEAVL